MADLPLRLAYGHLLIDMAIDGIPSIMVFDTGAFTTTIDEGAIERLRLQMGQPVAGRIEGVGGSRPFFLVTAKTIALGNLRGRNFTFASTDMGPFRKIADGLLSSDFLSRFDIDLDFPAGRLILYKPAGLCTHPTVFLDPPLYAVPIEPFAPYTRTPTIMVKISGKSFTAAIDTGAPSTIMTRSAAARLGLRFEDLKQDRQTSSGGIGPSQVRTAGHILDQIDIGDLSIRNMPIGVLDQETLPGEDLVLGLDFQTRVHLWISYSSRTLVVQYPPRPSPIPAGLMQ